MARRHNTNPETDDLAGTVEGLARDHFEREKAAYEARTGEKVLFVPPMPVTRTPIAKSDEAPELPEAPAPEAADTNIRMEGDE